MWALEPVCLGSNPASPLPSCVTLKVIALLSHLHNESNYCGYLLWRFRRIQRAHMPVRLEHNWHIIGA